MYLKQLYQQHKGWFLFVVLFIAGQLFINFKRGVVFSPFYHYGMYSEKVNLTDSIAIAEIIINNKPLKPFDFSAQEWDKLVLPIYFNSTVATHNNDLYRMDIERLLKKIGLQPKEQDYIMAWHDSIGFIKWYKPYAEKIIGEKIKDIHINQYELIIQDVNLKKSSANK